MPTKYVHLTDEQKEQARQTDLCELLRSQGETLKRSGTEYEWKDGSQKVTIRETYGFINMTDRAAMPLTSSEDSITKITQKQFPICSTAAMERFQYLRR